MIYRGTKEQVSPFQTQKTKKKNQDDDGWMQKNL